ncbi:flagellar motor stator protein MotA [Verticiella sediminum]|uniref:Flagellar motor stator protein MotA n=1 Tax=Verticiella sediminum TaxID=1247510 RepID=A0A556ARY4_9BURK|nr:flagellar motor stator protein MotA [Verticiella sediminum]TSH95702.1 flagellar motor stator protein MotA [Verticiella sediminum]
MLIVLGFILVFGSVFGGFVLVGGHLGALYQPVEVLIIGGAAVGSFIAANNGKSLRATAKMMPRLFRGARYDKTLYMELMALLYVLLTKARREGMMALESHVEDPASSAIFSAYPRILADAVLVEFITDYLRLMVSGNMSAFEIETLMDSEIETYQHEADVPATALRTVADALPAFGIVAAVLGVVHALSAIDQPPAILGDLISKAMVGTFLGILLAYGFVSPLASRTDRRNAESVKIFECIKTTLLANLNGYPPQLAVEFGRKVLYSTERPSFMELDEHVRTVKGR